MTDKIKLTHKFYSLMRVFSQLINGKSLWRTLLNLSLSDQYISGKVLDLGSKNGGSSYYNYLILKPGTEIIYSDIEEKENVVAIDVEQAFPIPDSSLDYILALNLFEHVYSFHIAPKEAFRTLRRDGIILVATPFLFPYHPDPDDYFRFTDSAILRIWTDVGFQCIYIEALGEGVITNFSTIFPEVILPRFGRAFLTALLYLFTSPLDRLIARFRPKINGRTVPERYPLGYLAIFKKTNHEASYF